MARWRGFGDCGTILAARLLPLAATLLLLCACPAAAQTPPWQCGPCWCDGWASLLAGSATARCDGTVVEDIPAELPLNVSSLTLTRTALTTLRADRLSRFADLVVFYLAYDLSLVKIERHAFHGLLKLTDLIINHCKNLRTIDAGALSEFGQLRSVDLRYNGLLDVPDFSAFINVGSTLSVRVNLDNNSISRLSSHCWCKNACHPSVEFGPVSIRSNILEEVEEMAFAGSAITSLDLSNNMQLRNLHSSSFEGISLLSTLWLANTSISSLPSTGLESLRELHLENTPSLKTLPPTVQYEELRRAYMHYPHLCCAFQYPKVQNEIMYDKIRKLQEDRCAAAALSAGEKLSPTRSAVLARRAGLAAELRSRRAAAATARNGSMASKFGSGGASWGAFNLPGRRSSSALSTPPASATAAQLLLYDSLRSGQWLPNSSFLYDQMELAHNPCSSDDWNLHLWREQNFRCTPVPNAFNPCIDVLEADWLRSCMWFAALLTVLGNAAVLLLTLFVKAPMTVSKFLVCNLVLADFFLGTYLIALAVVDARTKGNYFNHVMSWQYGAACNVVGFLAVFGAELSVFTLVIITVERWYTISNAMHLTKRIKMRHAIYIMCGGWLVCFLVAIAPALGASSYQITSLCLPFRYESSADKAYVILLITANVIAVVVVTACYTSMYSQVRGSSRARVKVNKSDTEMAKRMAYLVTIDFLCWGPVAAVAALSAGGVDINVPSLSGSSLTHAKVVLTLFFPINALANPFLYAILTRQFQNDVLATFYRWGMCQKEFMSYAMDTFGHSSTSAGAGRRVSSSRSAGDGGDRLPLTNVRQLAPGALLPAASADAAGGVPVTHSSAELRRGSGTSGRSCCCCCCCCDGRQVGGRGGSSASLLHAHQLHRYELNGLSSNTAAQPNEEIELTDAACVRFCCSCSSSCYRLQSMPAAEIAGQRRLLDDNGRLDSNGLRQTSAGSSTHDICDCKSEQLRCASPTSCSACADEEAVPTVAASNNAAHYTVVRLWSSEADLIRPLADYACSPSDADRQEEDTLPSDAVSVAAAVATAAMLGDTQAIWLSDDGTGRLQRRLSDATSAVVSSAVVDVAAEMEPLLGDADVRKTNTGSTGCAHLSFRDVSSRQPRSCSSYNAEPAASVFPSAGPSCLAVS